MTKAADPGLPEPDFPTTRFPTAGYDQDEVDAFCRELVAALRHEPPTMAPYEVADQRFHVSRRRRGYDLREVNVYLHTAQRLLKQRQGSAAIADLEGHESQPRHVRTGWIYAVALVLVAAILFLVLRLM